MRTRVATVTIAWAEYSNEDLGDDTPDNGWYIDVDVKGGPSASLGPDFYGPGCKTIDEAMQLVEKWAADRGLEVTRPFITMAVTKP